MKPLRRVFLVAVALQALSVSASETWLGNYGGLVGARTDWTTYNVSFDADTGRYTIARKWHPPTGRPQDLKPVTISSDSELRKFINRTNFLNRESLLDKYQLMAKKLKRVAVNRSIPNIPGPMATAGALPVLDAPPPENSEGDCATAKEIRMLEARLADLKDKMNRGACGLPSRPVVEAPPVAPTGSDGNPVTSSSQSGY